MYSFSVEYIHMWTHQYSQICPTEILQWVCFLSRLDYWVILHCMYGYTMQHTEMFLKLHTHTVLIAGYSVICNIWKCLPLLLHWRALHFVDSWVSTQVKHPGKKILQLCLHFPVVLVIENCKFVRCKITPVTIERRKRILLLLNSRVSSNLLASRLCFPLLLSCVC